MIAIDARTKRRIVALGREQAEIMFGKGEFALCAPVAMCTSMVAHRFGIVLALQAGSAYWPRVTPETDDGVEANRFGYEWEPHSPVTLERLRQGAFPELHVWLYSPATGEIVDPTSGAFPEQCQKLTQQAWKAPAPPDFFWDKPETLPDLASYRADKTATLLVMRMLMSTLQLHGR
jgi:hypothetical protein